MTRCGHCGGRIVRVGGRWVHMSSTSRHGNRPRPAFVTCPEGDTVATPRDAA